MYLKKAMTSFSQRSLLKQPKKVYLTKPIMSSLEKNQLMHQVQSDWLLPGISMPDVKDILDALKPYISLKKGVTEAQLYRVLHRKMNKILEKRRICVQCYRNY